MKEIYTTENWKLELAENWEGELDEDIHLLYHPDGVGCIQISGYLKEDNKITRNEIIELTDLDKEEQAYLKEYETGNFHGVQFVYSEGDIFWRKYWLANDNLLLFITYNCELNDKEIEVKVIKEMLKTLKKIKNKS